MGMLKFGGRHGGSDPTIEIKHNHLNFPPWLSASLKVTATTRWLHLIADACRSWALKLTVNQESLVYSNEAWIKLVFPGLLTPPFENVLDGCHSKLVAILIMTAARFCLCSPGPSKDAGVDSENGEKSESYGILEDSGHQICITGRQ